MRIVVAVVFFACILAPTALAASASALPANDSSAMSNDAAQDPSAPGCESQIIVTFLQPLDGDPDEDLVSSLAAGAGVRLVFLRSAGTGLYVFALMGRESDVSCDHPLERLRRDPRVRSADIDTRRKPHITRF
jgi:hypothetical protein